MVFAKPLGTIGGETRTPDMGALEAGSYNEGETVYFWSVTNKEWIKTKVLQVTPSGVCKVACRPNEYWTVQEQATLFRRVPLELSGPGDGSAGDHVPDRHEAGFWTGSVTGYIKRHKHLAFSSRLPPPPGTVVPKPPSSPPPRIGAKLPGYEEQDDEEDDAILFRGSQGDTY